ncbi:MAG: DEAD/DEAH box helicase [Methylophilaceae bacterium]|nr:DEAD/DEAH box helicase [Methylophilaceae bacterium]
MTFASLNLHPSILRAIEDSGYTIPTPIQAQAIPEVLAGNDIMASAQTGTGKTAAFMLPALNLLATPHTSNSRGPRILVLVPTRELAAQVNDSARNYGKHIRARTVSIVGGMPYPLQNKLLSQPLDILVATPGRFIDHLERGRIDVSRLQMLILDEADRMLDMGFMPDVERICNALPVERQTLLFSATLDGNIGRIARDILRNPKTIQVAQQKEKHANIEQRLHYVDDMTHKNKLLEHLLIAPGVNQAIIFTSTKRHADILAEDLYAAGHKTAALHGDMTQGARNRTLTKLRHGDVKVLVATDVAARGIDINGITHVINYDLPKFAEDYVHRIGRTGRAGASGIAISFASNMDRHILRKIEQYTGNKLEAAVVEGFEPKRAISTSDAPSGRRGNSNSRAGHKPGGSGGYAPRGNDRGGYGARSDSGRSDASRSDSNRGEGRSNESRSFGRDGSGRADSPRPTEGRTFGDRAAAVRPANSGFNARDNAPRENSRENFGNREGSNRGEANGNTRSYAGRDSAPRSADTRNQPGRSFGTNNGGRSEGSRTDSRPARSETSGNSARYANRDVSPASDGATKRTRSFV